MIETKPQFKIHGDTRRFLQKRRSELKQLVIYWWLDYPKSEGSEEEQQNYERKKEELRCLEEVLQEPYNE